MINSDIARSSIAQVVALVAVGSVGLVLGAALMWQSSKSVSALSYDTDSYQAVFLSNNQVYFGKISGLNTQYPVLSSVYYIQAFAAQDLSSTTKTGNQLQLVKLGSELHHPKGMMYLNRDQILFIEPLKSDSQIVKSIMEFEKK